MGRCKAMRPGSATFGTPYTITIKNLLVALYRLLVVIYDKNTIIIFIYLLLDNK